MGGKGSFRDVYFDRDTSEILLVLKFQVVDKNILFKKKRRTKNYKE
jgi:hypothetical protein